ncbi:YiiX/YebB-like N1pC/P60 family cysteine hydrolase [Streptobacillus ratti]|uniref:YiiX/YebB-like N1pC/P60 family cysteine hydrolase n=1 Tax=Streptobacillus ratti TaxID=1720557 RepID=UPI00093524F9|nr:YiiX/YebB-like N1pC/P60 family cysteine hydrolase [Streptobacillus ratti]
MKKILLIIAIFFSFNVYSYNFNDYHWYTFKYVNRNIQKLKPFDIIVLNKGKEITQQFGHLFILNKDKKLVEIKGLDDYFSDSPIYSFSHIDNRKITVLRYKKMNKELEEEIEKILPKYYNKKYHIFVGNDPDNLYTYCSNFVYNIFLEASKNLKIDEIELVKNKYPILPFNFLDSKELENIYLGEE